jgi:hypothetical protein
VVLLQQTIFLPEMSLNYVITKDDGKPLPVSVYEKILFEENDTAFKLKSGSYALMNVFHLIILLRGFPATSTDFHFDSGMLFLTNFRIIYIPNGNPSKLFQNFSVFLDKILEVSRSSSGASSILGTSGKSKVSAIVQTEDDAGIAGKQANISFYFLAGQDVVFYSKLQESIQLYSNQSSRAYFCLLLCFNRRTTFRGAASSLFCTSKSSFL